MASAKAAGLMGVDEDDIVLYGRRFSVCEGSAVLLICASVDVAPDAGMSSSQGGSGRGSGIDS